MGHNAIIAGIVSLCLISGACVQDIADVKNPPQTGVTVFTPEVSNAPLINPDKGWVAYGRSPSDGQQQAAVASVGYSRFWWASLEPEEGVYNWAPIDDFVEAWAASGKQAAFGIMSASTHASIEYVTPKWVFDAGVEEHKWLLDNDGDIARGINGWKHEPANWEDPVLLEKVANFTRALADRYDGHPDIAFIDIRSAHNWGESISEPHALIYAEMFQHTRIIQSTHNQPHATGAEQAAWCAERGIGVRRDGIGGSKGEELIPAIGKVPAVLEFWGNVDYLKQRGWWQNGELINVALETAKPSFIEVVRSSPSFPKDYLPLVESTTNKIGFHFTLQRLEIGPLSAADSGEMLVTAEWRNTGVAPLYVPAMTRLVLLNTDNVPVASADLPNSRPNEWQPGEAVKVSDQISFAGDYPSGEYKLAIGLFRKLGQDEPVYRLGNKTEMLENWHLLGSVVVE